MFSFLSSACLLIVRIRAGTLCQSLAIHTDGIPARGEDVPTSIFISSSASLMTPLFMLQSRTRQAISVPSASPRNAGIWTGGVSLWYHSQRLRGRSCVQRAAVQRHSTMRGLDLLGHISKYSKSGPTATFITLHFDL